MSRHIQDALIGPLLQHLTSCSHAITLRHDHIDHEEIDATSGEAEHVKGFGTRIGFEDSEALFGEDPVGHPAGNSFVVDDQDGRCGRQKGGQRQPLGVREPMPEFILQRPPPPGNQGGQLVGGGAFEGRSKLLSYCPAIKRP
jgi:hypothetical protein